MLKEIFFLLVAFVLNFFLSSCLTSLFCIFSKFHIFGRITMGSGGVLSNGRVISVNSVFLLVT